LGVWNYYFEKSVSFNVRMSIYGSQERSSRMLAAAAAIARFKDGRSLDDGTGNDSNIYETLLDIVGDSHTALEICRLLSIPEAKVRSYAGEIIDLLLFNKANDPYVSLGLPRDTPVAAVNRRWKSLLLLYHPDKYSNQKDYEERAKRINESYERIRSAKGHVASPEPVSLKKVKVTSRAGTERIRLLRRLRYLPDLLLALAVITALISALIFIGILRHPDAQFQREGQSVSERR
jgi:DnaJ-domain-containing protein 1